MSGARAWGRVAAVVAAVLIADQLTKALVRSAIPFGGAERVLPGIDLVNVRNDGVAFGLASGGGALIIAVTAAAVVALLAFFAVAGERRAAWLPVGMLLGGALGNLVDRLLAGSVTDFVDLPAWPPFNVADASITLGVLTLLYVLERGPRQADGSGEADGAGRHDGPADATPDPGASDHARGPAASRAAAPR